MLLLLCRVAFATLTTLGYGDIFPGTVCSRGVAICYALVGIVAMGGAVFLSPCFVFSILFSTIKVCLDWPGLFKALCDYLIVAPREMRMMDFI